MSLNRLANLANKVFNTPLAIHPTKAEVIVAALADHLGMSRPLMIDSPRAGFYDDGDDEFSKPSSKKNDIGYDIVGGGIAVIEVKGTLVQRNRNLRPYSGMTGYDGIRHNIAHAMTNPSVNGIVFDIDSPGGEVAGCFDLVDFMYKLRGVKPTAAILSEMAYSAAYAIASATDRVYVPRTGGVGSVGVVTMHVDLSKALDKEGWKVTFITYGDRKAEGNPYEPLADDARARIQSEIDKMGRLFVETVARNRGMTIEDVENTQAACYMGRDGVLIGFADIVASPDEAFADFARTL